MFLNISKMAGSSSSLSDELICSICLETFNTPVLLPCAHTFCKQCLINVRERSRVRNPGSTEQPLVCPQCRKEFCLGPAGIEELPKNLSLANIILSVEEEKKNQNLLCEVCDYEPAKTASKVCSDCSVTYCITCFRQLHPMRGAFKYHMIKEANYSPHALRCASPLVEGRTNRFTPSREGYGTDGAESGDESGIYANQDSKDQLENIRRQIKAKRKELSAVTQTVQSLLKLTEEETEERMREIRSLCCQLNENIGEREANMLTTVSQRRHEAVRQCLALSSEVKAQFLSLDLLEDQVNDIVSVTAVHTGTDVTKDMASLLERVIAVQSKSLGMRAKLVPKQPKVREMDIQRGLEGLDFVKENTLLSPVFTEFVYRPVSSGPAGVEVKWRQMDHVMSFRLSFTKKDTHGYDVTSSVELPSSVTSYQMKLDSADADYDVRLTATSDEGETHPQVNRNIRTLPYIHCFRARFNPATSHKRVAVSSLRDEIVHRKCKQASLHKACSASSGYLRLENLEGAFADEPLPLLPYVYWEAVIQFRVFGKLGNSKLLCDLGVCKSGSEDESSLLCDNDKSYCCYLVRRNNKIVLEFWNGPNRETVPRSIPILDLTQDTEKILKLGFYWDAMKRTLAVVSPGQTSMALCTFQVRFPTLSPVAGLYCSDQVYVMVKLTDPTSHKLPNVLAKLIKGANR